MDAAARTPERSDDDSARELDRLRRRAYGPDADITADAAAQFRLAQLEAARRAPPGPLEDDRSASPPPTTAAPSEGAAPSAGHVDSTASPDAAPQARGPHAAAPHRSRKRARVGMLIAAGAVLFTLGITIGVFWPTSSDNPDDTPDAVLDISSDPQPWRDQWDRALDFWGLTAGSMVPYEQFAGLGVWTGHAAGDARCLVLTQEEAIVTATCASAGLDPIFDLTVGRDVAADSGTGLPEGTVLRFRADDGEVAVWVRQPAGQVGESAPSSSAVSVPSRA
ncbi:hypothetical protein JOD63_001071 [Microbacterium terrae]|nr:hypothetical protein [Microbacterium terrae]MBP1077103.1 hypothetical protein [Microbacterium terrae]GLJ99698.1 hypothetical protein GCM10017594_28960 [Microbacterium terrae]